MVPMGFEPMLLSEVGLESTALDRSAIVPLRKFCNFRFCQTIINMTKK